MMDYALFPDVEELSTHRTTDCSVNHRIVHRDAVALIDYSLPSKKLTFTLSLFRHNTVYGERRVVPHKPYCA